MGEMLNLIAFFIGLIYSFISIQNIIKSKSYVSSIIYIVFFIIFILPLGIDVWQGETAYYGTFYIITKSVANEIVIKIYALFTIYFSIIFNFLVFRNFLSHKNNSTEITLDNNEYVFNIYKKWRYIFWLLVYLPIILVIFSPEKEKFLIYGYSSMRDFGDTMNSSIGNIYLSVNISVIVVFAILLIKRKGISSVIPYIPILMFDVWINGKRNIVVLVLVFLLYLILTDKKLRVGLKIGIVVFLIGLSSLYFSYYKTIKPNLYKKETTRIEYFRDHTVKLALYSELYPEELKILDYRGQSLLFYITIFIPRSMWKDKPMPYAQYLTSAALGIPPDFNGWGITNSIFDELICNLGIWIIFLFPFFIFCIVKYSDPIRDRFTSIFTILIICLLFSVQITAYYPLYIIYTVYVIHKKQFIFKNN